VVVVRVIQVGYAKLEVAQRMPAIWAVDFNDSLFTALRFSALSA
jgi:hypothetical protein